MPKRKVDVNKQEGPEEPKRPELTKEEIQKLFATYDAADAAFEMAKSKVDTLSIKRQAAVKDIYEKVGAGPFTRKGRRVQILKRGDSYFFKGENTTETIEVD